MALMDAFCIDHHSNDYVLLATSVKLLHVLLSDIIKSNTVRKVKVLILSESRLRFLPGKKILVQLIKDII